MIVQKEMLRNEDASAIADMINKRSFLGEQFTPAKVLQLAGDPSCRVVVATNEDTVIIGAIIIQWLGSDSCEIKYLSVKEQDTKRNIANELLFEALQTARDLQQPKVECILPKEYEASIPVFERNEFVIEEQYRTKKNGQVLNIFKIDLTRSNPYPISVPPDA